MTNQTEQGAAGRFTKKPATIDAWMIDIDNEPRPKWVQLAFASDVIGWCPAGEGLYIDTLEGYMKGKNGDWLIRGVKGELYPCKPDIFAATYEPAGAVSTPEGCTLESWRPIETAPEGCDVLLWSPKFKRPHIGDWRKYIRYNLPKYTHWMPLPAAPAATPGDSHAT